MASSSVYLVTAEWRHFTCLTHLMIVTNTNDIVYTSRDTQTQHRTLWLPSRHNNTHLQTPHMTNCLQTCGTPDTTPDTLILPPFSTHKSITDHRRLATAWNPGTTNWPPDTHTVTLDTCFYYLFISSISHKQHSTQIRGFRASTSGEGTRKMLSSARSSRIWIVLAKCCQHVHHHHWNHHHWSYAQ